MQTPFGLTGSDDAIFVSDWDDGGAVYRVTKTHEDNPLVEKVLNNLGTPMGVYYTPTSLAPGWSGCDGLQQIYAMKRQKKKQNETSDARWAKPTSPHPKNISVSK